VKKLLAAVAALAPAIALLPAAPASADSVCAPVTIDGQPVCQDVTPIEQAIATAEATALATATTVEGLAFFVLGTALGPFTPEVFYADVQAECLTGAPQDSANVVAVDVVQPANVGLLGGGASWSGPTFPECRGTEVTVPSPGTAPGPIEHVHVPQICLTTTGNCVGPVDQDIQVPIQPTVSVCTQPETIQYTPYSFNHWYRTYDGPISCTTVG
jgi:hypothetical protein